MAGPTLRAKRPFDGLSNQKDETTNGTLEKPPLESRLSTFAIVHATAPEWSRVMTIASLIFGGCCANVYALEAIVKESPSSGILITCTQFLLTSMLSLISHLDFSRGLKHFYLKPRGIPFQRWLVYTSIFLTINVLNNKAFDYEISIPLHIILRSAGPIASMAVGYVAGKRYSKIQVLAVGLLFLGIVQAAVADLKSKGAQIDVLVSASRPSSNSLAGFGLLYLSMLLTAILGLYTDRTYATYGRDHWNENLFYSHTLSLPFFLTRWRDLSIQAQALSASPPMAVFMAGSHQSALPNFLHQLMARTPIQLPLLLLNGLTQYLCIRGVNVLAAQSSSLTVTMVLSGRKCVSLILSIWLFGNRLAPGVLFGAFVVFVGGGLYALPAKKPVPVQSQRSKKEL
jgi:solute carrier family 35 (UDP-xylose/UDP-N-acetylglucosamine transporter), member B4